MKIKGSTIYAIFCTLLLAAGFLLTFIFAWGVGTREIIMCIIGLVSGYVLAPVIHELGHVSLAQIARMDYVYVKCFCFKIYVKNGKKRFGFASPFAPDETQVLPKCGGNMQKRGMLYALGGLIFGGVFLAVILAAAILTTAFGVTNYLLWGIVPYALYLFLLNVAPFEYASGKTDTLIYQGLKKGAPAEKNMLSAMEIQGQLYEGKSFSEIGESLYFDVPQLCEDEPLFAVMLDLRYRYFLEKGEKKKAADCLNRLASLEEYLPQQEVEKIAAELVYMNALFGLLEDAEENGKACQAFLKAETPTAKRILAAWAKANGQTEFVSALLAQAENCLNKERVLGVRKFEKILLDRIKED